MKLHEPMPELTGATAWLNGEVTKSELVGEKPTLIHFWAVSCNVCKETMPEVNELRDKYKDDLNVVAVHMPLTGADNDMDKIRETAEQYGLTQPVFVDSEYKLTDAFENELAPAYYVFDREGQLRHYQAGRTGLDMVEDRIERVIEQ
ncbi:TlpA family protein disulfide reductase [Bhargavaea beijingensis]|uniref:Redoxin domain-containing protein n=1 Tax=Bhargavaea beijingensis TaxID=426756 RepID=A0ABX9ZEP2_9BACL|nr:redoxin family protein [Bhargavaea beijingensis]MCW1928036.1 redoxin domain-containing protein [Bhargavaea beijingensis]RSK34264.1 redoxin domain-containing protein [Bhargavaea beijingensis]